MVILEETESATATAGGQTKSSAPISNDDGLVSVSNQSTKSSQGRKLRQVLQKKQLDVLLQTYSSFIDEVEESPVAPSVADYSLIARKSSIEGNPSTIGLAAEMELLRKCRSEASMGEERAPLGDFRKSRSLLEEDQSYSFVDGEERQQEQDSILDNSNEAVAETKRGRNLSNYKEIAARRSKKKNNPSSKRKNKKVAFSARMLKANEALKSFSGRAFEKQLEVAADFQEASKEIGYQLKSGANVVLEELADKFDGIVENIFANETTETRDENGGEARDSSQLAVLTSQKLARVMEAHCGGLEARDPDFQPRSHEETLQAMNRQVHDILEPVVFLADRAQVGFAGVAKELSDKAQVGCAGVAEDLVLPAIEAADTKTEPITD